MLMFHHVDSSLAFETYLPRCFPFGLDFNFRRTLFEGNLATAPCTLKDSQDSVHMGNYHQLLQLATVTC